MARVTPPVGTQGLFLVRLPFVLNPALTYHVSAQRTFEEIIAEGLDPVKVIYTPAGIGQLEYEADQAEGAVIIALSSPSTKTLYIPDTYIQSYPNMAVVPHSWLVASVSLGMMPDIWDTTGLTEAIQTSVSDYTGVQPTVNIARAPTTDAVTQDQYIQMQAARNAAIKTRSSLYADKLSLTADRDRLLTENASLFVIIDQLNARIAELEGSAPGN